MLVLVLAALTLQATRPALTSDERMLVGTWGRPDDSGVSTWTKRDGRPFTNPWIVLEFGGDRTYRQWVVEMDRSGDRSLLAQGRWQVIDGRLRLEDLPPGIRRNFRDGMTRLAGLTGLPIGSYGPNTQGDLVYRTNGRYDLEFPPSDQAQDRRTWKWKRLSGMSN